MGEEALRCAVRAERGARASAQAERAAERAAVRVAERSGAKRCARLLILRTCACWHGVALCSSSLRAREAGVACAAPLACSFTFLGDGSFLFVVALHSIGRWAISSLACLHRSLDHPVGVKSIVERCHANSKDQSTTRYKLKHKLISLHVVHVVIRQSPCHRGLSRCRRASISIRRAHPPATSHQPASHACDR